MGRYNFKIRNLGKVYNSATGEWEFPQETRGPLLAINPVEDEDTGMVPEEPVDPPVDPVPGDRQNFPLTLDLIRTGLWRFITDTDLQDPAAITDIFKIFEISDFEGGTGLNFEEGYVDSGVLILASDFTATFMDVKDNTIYFSVGGTDYIFPSLVYTNRDQLVPLSQIDSYGGGSSGVGSVGAMFLSAFIGSGSNSVQINWKRASDDSWFFAAP